MRAICRQLRRIRCGNFNALLLLAHGVRRHRVTFQLSDGEAGEIGVVGRLNPANEVPSGISSQSLLTSIGAALVLVKHRISRQAGKYSARKVMPSFSLTPEGVPRVSSEASSGPVVQPTTQVPPIVEFLHSGSSSLLFCAKVLAKYGNTVVVMQMVNCPPVSAEVYPSRCHVRVVDGITLDLAS